MSNLHYPMMRGLVLFIVTLRTSHSSSSSIPAADYGASMHSSSHMNFVMFYPATSTLETIQTVGFTRQSASLLLCLRFDGWRSDGVPVHLTLIGQTTQNLWRATCKSAFPVKRCNYLQASSFRLGYCLTRRSYARILTRETRIRWSPTLFCQSSKVTLRDGIRFADFRIRTQDLRATYQTGMRQLILLTSLL